MASVQEQPSSSATDQNLSPRKKSIHHKRLVISSIGVPVSEEEDNILEYKAAKSIHVNAGSQKAKLSATFSRKEVKEMQNDTYLWKEEFTICNKGSMKCRIGIKKLANGMCEILLENCKTKKKDTQSYSFICWVCSERPRDFTAMNELGCCKLVDLQEATHTCNLNFLPIKWTVKFNLWPLQSSSDVIPGEKPVKLFPDFDQDAPESLLRVNWILKDVESLRNYKLDEFISSEPFGDWKEEVMMCLELYPNRRDEQSAVILEVYVRMLHLHERCREYGLRMKCETCVNNVKSFSSEVIYKEDKIAESPVMQDEMENKAEIKIEFDILRIGIDLYKIENRTDLDKMKIMMNYIYFDERIILEILEKEKQKFGEKQFKLMQEMLTNKQKYIAAMRNTLLAFAEPHKLKMKTARHFMDFSSFRKEITDYILEQYSSLLKIESNTLENTKTEVLLNVIRLMMKKDLDKQETDINMKLIVKSGYAGSSKGVTLHAVMGGGLSSILNYIACSKWSGYIATTSKIHNFRSFQKSFLYALKH